MRRFCIMLCFVVVQFFGLPLLRMICSVSFMTSISAII